VGADSDCLAVLAVRGLWELRFGRQPFDTDSVIHENRVMKNVTITLDERVARWARIRAAESETSLSRLVGDMLREKMRGERTYEGAMRQYLSQPPATLKRRRERYPRRQDLHER
jgi:hypothetical protein